MALTSCEACTAERTLTVGWIGKKSDWDLSEYLRDPPTNRTIFLKNQQSGDITSKGGFYSQNNKILNNLHNGSS